MTATRLAGRELGAAVVGAEAVVRRLTGLIFPESREDTLAAAVQAGIERTRSPDVASYLARLEADAGVLDDLVARITVGETYFFRDPGQFALIGDEILPALIRTRPDVPLRMWSAGCASGEEAYTLAILLEQRGLLSRAAVVGTDISRKALQLARRARYGRWSLRGVSNEVVDAYFEPSAGAFELIGRLRSSVDFRYLNLAVDVYPSLASGISGMDLILCRNVLIYFDAETTRRAAERLVASLSPGGWLVTGASDPPLGDLVPCTVEVTDAGLVYRPVGSRRTRLVHRTPEPPAVQFEPVPRPTPLPSPAPQPPEPTQVPARAEEMERAIRAYEAHDYALSAEMAERHTRGPVSDATAWVILVRSLANRGALEAAGRACAAGLDRHRTSAELAYLHGLLLLESGRSSEAVAALRRALYLDRGQVVTHLALASALAKAGDARGARRALRSAERLLRRFPSGALVPASDGERADRLREAARAQLTLLSEADT